MVSPLTNVFSTMKKQGLVKMLDQYLLKVEYEDDGDRKNETNSPSGALGCSRANIYQRLGTRKDTIAPRTRRIFDNGHGVHDRLQTYLEKAGVLMMREVPLSNKQEEIQGHTDGLLCRDVKAAAKGRIDELEILEIKSINSRQFAALKTAKEEHIAQGNVYLFCLEEHRKFLRKTYKTYEEFKKSKFMRRVYYTSLYQHVKGGSKYTKAEKIKHKVNQHIQCDDLLYRVKKPINRVIFLYECKDTQELKEFDTERNDELLQETLEKYRINNYHFKEGTLPERECKNRTEGKFCNYVNTCFPR